MRLALLTQSYPPMVSGAALVVERLARGLAGRGHPVLLLAASDRGPAYVEEFGSLLTVRLRALPNPFRVGQRFLLWPAAEIAAELGRFRPEVFHSHDPLILSLAGLPAARGLPRLLTVHQLPWFISLMAPPPLRRPVEAGLWRYGRWLYRRFDAIITPSQTIADLVAAHSPSRPQVISNGLDTERFNPAPTAPGEAAALRRKYGLDPDLPVVLYAGRLDVDKRVDRVLRAATGALPSAPGQLVIAGDGRERARLMALSDSLGLAGRVHFPGFVPASGDLPGLYRLATLFVTASEVEIQSSVALEAMASGLPVVAARASSMPEFVRDGVTGWLTPPGDSSASLAALAGRMAELLRQPARAQAMGRAGLAVARQHSQVHTLDAHEQLYAELLGVADPQRVDNRVTRV